MNEYAKFRNFPLRTNKALGIFRIVVTTKTSENLCGYEDDVQADLVSEKICYTLYSD